MWAEVYFPPFLKWFPTWGPFSTENPAQLGQNFRPHPQIRCRVTSQPSFPGNRKRAKMNFIMKPSQPTLLRIVRSILRTFPQILYSVFRKRKMNLRADFGVQPVVLRCILIPVLCAYAVSLPSFRNSREVILLFCQLLPFS